MITQVTHGIRVSVQIFYQERYSQPKNEKFFFAYRIRIENQSEKSVQLLSRQWQIFDSSNVNRKVEGEGVVGEQPTIAPGQYHEYVSWCHLTTEIGKMWGTYLMKTADDERFRVQIPEFELVVDYRQN